MRIDQKRLESLVSKNELVQIQQNPIIHNAVELSLDEFFAFILSIIGTLVVSAFSTSVWLLSISGPLSEKPGFFVRHIYDAYKASKAKKGSFSHILRKELRRSYRSLITDILFHDTIYALFAFVLLKTTTLHPGFIVVVAFCAAIPFAAAFQYAAEEVLHIIQKMTLRLRGMKWETYYESRFFFVGDEHKLLDEVRKEFKLKNPQTGIYTDQYAEEGNWFAEHHEPFMRVRTLRVDNKIQRRVVEKGFRTMKRLNPLADQYNYHFIKKEKGSYVVDDMQMGVHKNLQQYFGKDPKLVSSGVSFARKTYHNHELSVSIDTLKHASSKVKVIEVKVYSDIALLTRAMRFLNRLYPVVETTLPKERFVETLKSL